MRLTSIVTAALTPVVTAVLAAAVTPVVTPALAAAVTAAVTAARQRHLESRASERADISPGGIAAIEVSAVIVVNVAIEVSVVIVVTEAVTVSSGMAGATDVTEDVDVAEVGLRAGVAAAEREASSRRSRTRQSSSLP